MEILEKKIINADSFFYNDCITTDSLNTNVAIMPARDGAFVVYDNIEDKNLFECASDLQDYIDTLEKLLNDAKKLQKYIEENLPGSED